MRVERRVDLAVTAETAFMWHARPGAFERLIPPWERVRMVSPYSELTEGGAVTFEIDVGPLRQVWLARHSEVIPGREFVDTLERSLFDLWRHRHRFEPRVPSGSTLIDEIECSLPGGPFGTLAEPLVRRRIERGLRYRHAVVAADLALHDRRKDQGLLQVAITGASGFIGRTLSAMLSTGGHTVIPLVRRTPRPGERQWDPAAGRLDADVLAGVDAVIHLAGESIAGRWSRERQAAIRRSRVAGTTAIVAGIQAASPRPRTMISASAVGYYGDRGDTMVDESRGAGAGFLPDVAVEWERATAPLAAIGVRSVTTRFGIVLSPAGGALATMLLPFRLGLGGRLGSGGQWMSWISIDDCAAAIIHLLRTDLAGPVNLVAPEPVTNADFTRTLGKVLGQPTPFPVPPFLLRAAVGGLADEGLLASTRVMPTRLAGDGFPFRHANLEAALRHVLGREVSS